MKDFFSKCDQIRSFLRIWSHLLKKSFMENFIFLYSVAYLELYIFSNASAVLRFQNFSPRWFRKASFFFKFLKNESTDYLFKIIPQRRLSYITKNSDEVSIFKTKHNVYKNSFFPSTTIEWNNLNQELKNSECYTLFCYSIINFIRSSPYSFYSCQNITHIKLVIRLRLGLSHLREYKFKQF